MKSKTGYYILVACLIFLLSTSIFRNKFQNSKAIDNYISTCAEELKNIKIDIFLPKHVYNNIGNSELLVFCYDVNMCKPCIISDLERLRNGIDGIPCNNVFVLVLTGKTKEEHIKVTNELYDLNYTEISRDSLKLPLIEGIPCRFYVLLNKTGALISGYISSFSSDEYFDFLTTTCKISDRKRTIKIKHD